MTDHATPSPDGRGAPARWRVDELAARTGVPVRTIREYQTWQVLDPPTREGRVGWYDERHVRRLETIARLQQRGYSIAAMRDLFAAWEEGAALRDVLGLDDAAGVPADETPVWLTADQVAELLPAVAESERLRKRATRIGLLADDHGGYLARSPALVQLVADAVAAGITPTAALDVAEALVRAADTVGEVVAGVVAERADVDAAAIEPFVQRGRVLLARAAASHTIDRAGRHLMAAVAEHPDLAAVLAEVRIGTVARGNHPPIDD